MPEPSHSEHGWVPRPEQLAHSSCASHLRRVMWLSLADSGVAGVEGVAGDAGEADVAGEAGVAVGEDGEGGEGEGDEGAGVAGDGRKKAAVVAARARLTNARRWGEAAGADSDGDAGPVRALARGGPVRSFAIGIAKAMVRW